MQSGLHLAPIRRVAAARLRIIGAAKLDHLAGGSFHHLAAGDEIRVAQPNLASGGQPIEFLRRVLHEVVTLDIEFAAEAQAARARGRVVGMVDGVDLLELAFGIILDDDLQRTQNRHAPQGRFVENLAHGKVEHGHIDHAVGLGYPDPLDEVAHRLRRDTAPAQPCERGHARVVPARDVPATH